MNKRRFILYASIFFMVFIFGVIVSIFSRPRIQKGIEEIESTAVWNNVIAKSINKNEIKLKVDGEKVNLKKNALYMSENLELMISVEIITDIFHCAENLYNNKKLVVEKGETQAVMHLGKDSLELNGRKHKLGEKIQSVNEKIYIPISLFRDYFGYSYLWDSESNTASLKDNSETDSILPEKYSYIEAKRLSGIKDQGKYGTCWAFATLSAIETTLMPEEKFDFSENNLIHNNTLSEDIQDGGDYIMAMAYLMAWKGPVLEKDDPYGENKTNNLLKPVKHVQEAQIIPEKDYLQIKEMVYKYGGVESSMYMSMDNSKSESVYYNDEESSYCYTGNKKPNHDVVIIGWDDNYPKERFKNENIEGNGAFICMNSWGTGFGSEGVFYISYYDNCIGTNNVCYTKIEDIDNYDNIYQSDLCGWTGTMGFQEKDTVYFSNVYAAESDETLEAAGFYATTSNLEYQIFVCENYKEESSLNERNHVAAEGVIKNKGYYTIKLDKKYVLEKDKKFAIIVKIISKDEEAFKLIPVEMTSDNMRDKVDLSDGEGYFSSTGYRWTLAEKQNCNICLKAYTRNK